MQSETLQSKAVFTAASHRKYCKSQRQVVASTASHSGKSLQVVANVHRRDLTLVLMNVILYISAYCRVA